MSAKQDSTASGASLPTDGGDGSAAAYRRVVIKAGTNLLTAGTDRLDLEVMAALVSQISKLVHQGIEVFLVSSGAIAAGRHSLGVTKDSKTSPSKSALAAVGQGRLVQAYEDLFRWHGITVAQALLTRSDLTDRGGYLNVRNTLLSLAELRVVTVINENDLVSLDEIMDDSFGDNDLLSAMVANLVDADMLVILTDIDGLYTADPRVDPSAKLIPRVERVDDAIEKLAGASGTQRGRGGMTTKVRAAKLATSWGVAVAIAGGRTPNVLPRLAVGESVGTFFPPGHAKTDSRKRWLLSGLSARGELVVDNGAAGALRTGGKSLLPAGVRDARGDFQRGDIVTIQDASGRQVGYGIVNYDAAEVLAIKGAKSSRISELLGHSFGDEVVHRNNLVVL